MLLYRVTTEQNREERRKEGDGKNDISNTNTKRHVVDTLPKSRKTVRIGEIES